MQVIHEYKISHYTEEQLFFSASLVHTLNMDFYIYVIYKKEWGTIMIGIPFIPEYNSLKWHAVGQIKFESVAASLNFAYFQASDSVV